LKGSLTNIQEHIEVDKSCNPSSGLPIVVETESRSTEFFKGFDAKDMPKDALKTGDNL
jgi:hypothetical protein